MFYGNHKVRRLGLIFLSCSFLASCTNSSLTNQSSMISNPASPASQVTSPNSSPPGSTPTAIASSSSPKRTPQIDQQTKYQSRQEPQVLPISARVIITDQIIELEVAKTPQEQEIGLMFRTELLPNRGMLFPFQPARSVNFWMKNTLIPLDMVFLHQGIIQEIVAQVPPCTADPCPSYGPPFNVDIDQVIELSNGRVAELGLKKGDRLTVEPLP